MIEKTSNESFKSIRKLNNKRYRDATSDCFDILLEGERLIWQAIDYQLDIKSVYIREDRVEQYQALLSKRVSCPIYSLSKKQSDMLSETENEQGIFAQMRFKTIGLKNQESGAQHILVYLNGISDPGNLGAIFRCASAFGVAGLILDEACCDLSNSKLIRASLGAVFSVPVLKADKEWLLARKEKIYVTVSDAESDDCVSINEFSFPDTSYILVIGSEAHGVSDSIKKLAEKKVYIPMQSKMESLNVAVASGIFMYRMSMK